MPDPLCHIGTVKLKIFWCKMDTLLTKEQASVRLAVSQSVINHLIKTKVLPSIRISHRCLRIPEEAVTAYLQAQQVIGTDMEENGG